MNRPCLSGELEKEVFFQFHVTHHKYVQYANILTNTTRPHVLSDHLALIVTDVISYLIYCKIYCFHYCFLFDKKMDLFTSKMALKLQTNTTKYYSIQEVMK